MEYQQKKISEAFTKKGQTSFVKEYQGMTFDQRVEKAALNSSDNGRCWWIYTYLKTPVYSWEVKPRTDGKMDDFIHFN